MYALTWPRHALQSGLDELDLLCAMYPDELHIEQPADDNIAALRRYCQHDAAPSPGLPSCIPLELNLSVRVGQVSPPRSILMFIDLPLTLPAATSKRSLLRLRRIREPEWLTKNEAVQLASDLPEDEDIFFTIDHVYERAVSLIQASPHCCQTPAPAKCQPTVRAWFYFPSISTREKREDIVRHAPTHNLTGFLLAGKPGILCLEGVEQDIDAYMRYIKSVSWSDIPSQHKKVSERHRESGPGIARVFEDMQEITYLLEKQGERCNRGDMKALQAWLQTRGLASAFSSILL